MTPTEYLQIYPDATNAEVLAATNAPVYSAVAAEDMASLVTRNRLWLLEDLSSDLTQPTEVRAGIRSFFVALKLGKSLDRTIPEDNAQYEAILGMLVSAQMISSGAYAAFSSLGFSQRQDTNADVDEARDLLVRSVALNAIESRVESDRASFLNERINPAKTHPSLAVPTLAEWKALVNT